MLFHLASFYLERKKNGKRFDIRVCKIFPNSNSGTLERNVSHQAPNGPFNTFCLQGPECAYPGYLNIRGIFL